MLQPQPLTANSAALKKRKCSGVVQALKAKRKKKTLFSSLKEEHVKLN
jgi:hypothetical protein